MAYYDALKTQWATFIGTTAQKLAAINALTVAGPNVDVLVSAVVGELMLSGAFLTLQAFSQSAPNGVQVHDTALQYAKMLIAMISIPNAPAFATSDPNKYPMIKGMLDGVLAQETAAPGTTGITQAVHDALLALAATTIPWSEANGYGPPPLDMKIVTDAGLS